jgi:hypothetical protein
LLSNFRYQCGGLRDAQIAAKTFFVSVSVILEDISIGVRKLNKSDTTFQSGWVPSYLLRTQKEQILKK